MTSMRKRTLRGSVAARDALVDSITNLYSVAETDVTDVITEEVDPMLERERRRFVEALVDRMLFDDEILLDWIGEEQDDDEPWNDTEDAAPLAIGDRVTMKIDAERTWHGVIMAPDDDFEHLIVQWDHMGPGDPDTAFIGALEREVKG